MPKTVLVTGCMQFANDQIRSSLKERGLTPHFLDPISNEDIDRGYAHVDNDVCVSTAAIIGQYVRYFENNEFEDACVLAPELCKDCRAACTSALLRSSFERSSFGDVEVIGFTVEDLRGTTIDSAEEFETDPTVPVVGVCGNVPTLVTREFNRVIFDHLAAEGCQVATPPIELILGEKDFLTPSIEFFDACGITTVICLLPFGCLGGHAYARGQVRKMQKRFPHIGITMLDYDPSASDINLINRTELVIQSAKDRAD